MGNYIRINKINFKKKCFVYGYIAINVLYIIISIIVFKIGGVSKLMYILKYNLPFAYISSVLLFLIVLNTDFKVNDKIKK